MLQFGQVSLSLNNLNTIIKMITRPFSIIGLCCYAISAIFWMAALSRIELSRAYPMLSLGYVLILIVSHFIFSETLLLTKVIGIFIIIIGICLVGWVE